MYRRPAAADGGENRQEEPSTGDTINQPILKAWALDKPVKKTGIPTCLSTVVINNGKKPFPVGALARLPGRRWRDDG